jgi:hypothetical protein
MGKDDRILMVWSYLQTKDTFNPLELVKRLGNMNPRTIHNYLTIIQEDQFVNDAYIKHIRQPLMAFPYFVGSKTEDEKVFVQKLVNEWRKKATTQQTKTNTRYTFTGPNLDELYNRLETCLLIYKRLR